MWSLRLVTCMHRWPDLTIVDDGGYIDDGEIPSPPSPVRPVWSSVERRGNDGVMRG
jgi:hypothetical protein